MLEVVSAPGGHEDFLADDNFRDQLARGLKCCLAQNKVLYCKAHLTHLLRAQA